MSMIRNSRLQIIALLALAVTTMLIGTRWAVAAGTDSQAQMQIAKIGPMTVEVNEPIGYTVFVKNNEPLPITNVVVTDVIPTGATYIEGSGGTLVNGAVVWTIAEIASGETEAFTFAVTATDDIVNDTYRTTADGGLLAIGSTPIETEVAPAVGANVTISKSGPAFVEPNEPIIYSLLVNNTGDEVLTNVMVFDLIPDGAVFEEGFGGTLDGDSVTWNFGTLEVDQSIIFQFAVTADDDVINDTYQVTADGGVQAVGTVAVVTQVGQEEIEESFVYLPVLGRNRIEGEPNDTPCEAYEIGAGADIQSWRNDATDWFVVDLSEMPAGSTATFAVRDFAINGQVIVYEGENCTSLEPGINNGDFVRDKAVVIPNANPTTYYILTFVDSNPTFVFPYFVTVSYAP